MWIAKHIETKRATLDFRSSGQGRRQVTQLHIDGELFANALKLTDWEAARFQPLVCVQCGFEGCAPGNWLVARRAGRHVVLLPDYGALPEDKTEYTPPAYMTDRGALLFDETRYSELRSHISMLPPHDCLKQLQGWEAKRLFQYEAVQNAMGTSTYPVAVRQDLIVAVSEGDLQKQITNLKKVLDEVGDLQPVDLERIGKSVPPISFFIDSARWADWRPMAFVDGKARLLLAPDIVCLPGSKTG